ncbi:MAG: hypothetical protein BGO26_00470 [Actinobacteria bacterium 69-20]|jgi:hypothetical protein|nr:MAG: hypothetical protein BGO26_00470 [Actinobacteria bacterium 69-20]
MAVMRRSRIVVIAAAAVVLVAGATTTGVLLLRGPGPECTVPRPATGTSASTATDSTGTDTASQPAGPLTLDAVQLQHASTINAVGMARGLPERARIIAIATAWQESNLRNLDHGDLDSLGLFQQRHSQGWGDPAELMDPVYAAGQFYDHLVKVPGWQEMSLTKAAQAVQRSGFPDAYAKWEPDATALAEQLGGTVPVALTCRAGALASTAAAPARAAVPGLGGATPGLAGLVEAAQAEMTGLTVVSVSHDGDTATIDVALPNTGAADAGRALAAWTVAHATSMHVATVQVLDQQWRAHAWRTGLPDPLPAGQVTIALAP